jgi:outer membrane murein-binding lipoprotein Lpp
MFFLVVPFVLQAQNIDKQKIENLESEISRLESKTRNLELKVQNLESNIHNIRNKADPAIAFFLFAIFCAWWAQHTNRDPWVWFFLGLFFNIITGLVLLSKNAEDKRMK